MLQQRKHESRCDAERFTKNQIRANPLGHLRGDSGVDGVDIRLRFWLECSRWKAESDGADICAVRLLSYYYREAA